MKPYETRIIIYWGKQNHELEGKGSRIQKMEGKAEDDSISWTRGKRAINAMKNRRHTTQTSTLFGHNPSLNSRKQNKIFSRENEGDS